VLVSPQLLAELRPYIEHFAALGARQNGECLHFKLLLARSTSR
jgi:hypothetical protein